jgi:hypothetical protein
MAQVLPERWAQALVLDPVILSDFTWSQIKFRDMILLCGVITTIRSMFRIYVHWIRIRIQVSDDQI